MVASTLLMILYSFVRGYAAQTTSLTPTPTPIPSCGGCSLAPVTTTTTKYNATATRQESFLLFTGYYIASQYLSNRQCKLALGSLIIASPAFSVLQPAALNSTAFLSTAITSFEDYLGFTTCSAGGEDFSVTSLTSLPVATAFVTPKASNQSSSTPVVAGPNQNSTQPVPTHPSGSHDEKAKIAEGVAIPVAVLGLALLGFVIHRRWKTKKTFKEQDASSQRQGSPREDTQPYLQQKAELEAEEKRKYELEARERRLEMGTEVERYELPVGEGRMIQTRQELRGEEHSTELEVPR